MPRIKAPSAQAILATPRAFALWQLLSPKADGSVTTEALQALLDRYGQAKAEGEEISFEDFAAVFQKPATPADAGSGDCIGYAAFDTDGVLKPFRFPRRATLPSDVRMQVVYVGVCHSDIHEARNEWLRTTYPIVPGHEIVGIVTEVGSEVTKFKVGDRVGVGLMVGACRKCSLCTRNLEQHCPGLVNAFGSPDPADGTITRGGFSTHMLVNQDFVVRIPDKLNFADAAPLICAGITTYSPIKRYGFDKPGMHIGVAGLGGLGHLAVKFFRAMGVTVTVIDVSPAKRDEAMSVLGADHYLTPEDEDQMKAAAGTLDGIINTVPVTHALEPLMSLMKFGGTMVMVGVALPPPALPITHLIVRQHKLVGSLIGSTADLQAMLDFCADKGIGCMCEHIPMDMINTAFARVEKGDVRYRFVVDLLDSLVA